MGYELKSRFFVAKGPEPAQQQGFCAIEECGEIFNKGDDIVICRWGNGPDDWEKAHAACAAASPLNAASDKQGDLSVRRLDTPTKRYGLFYQEHRIFEGANHRSILAIIPFLRQYSDAIPVQGILAAHERKGCPGC